MRMAQVGSPMVGRDALLDELGEIASAAAAGTGSVVLLAGEAGVGKTSVAQALARQARDDLAVSWGSCVADRSAPAFWPWAALAGPEQAPAEAGDRAVGAPRFERLTALRQRVLAAAAARPRLHVIEDIQWADVASVLLLSHVGAAVVDAPLLVVATLRTGEPGSPQFEAALAEVRRAAITRDLRALDAGEVVELLRASGPVPDPAVVDLVVARTGGNPLFVSELLRVLPREQTVERQREALAGTVPDRVTDLVLHRLRRLPPAVVDLLATAAVLGPDGDVDVLAAAHRTDAGAVVDLLEQGRAAHVLDASPAGRWRFRHELVRDAVHCTVAGTDRARRHAAALDALAASPASLPAALAHHALSALPVVDADRAVALAARAGEAAFAQHAYEEAIDWFDRALVAAPASTSPRWRAQLLLLSGEAHRHIGEIPAARRAFLAAAEVTDDPDLLARAGLGYADPGADLGIAYRTHDADTAALLERAIAAQPSLDTVTGVQLEARLAAELYFSDEPGRARALATSALDRARRLDDARALGLAAAVEHDAFVVGQADLARQLEGSARLLAWARSSGSVASLLTAHRARVIDLLAAADIAGLDAEVVAFRRLAEPLRAPGYLWWPALWSAMRALLEGRHDVAEQRAAAAHALGEGSFPMLAFLNLSFLFFFLRREQGRLGELEQATRDFAAANGDVPAFRVSLTFLLAELGKLDEARASLAGFDDDALAALHDRNWPASWFQLARSAWKVGDEGTATRLLAAAPRERCVQVSLATVCLGAADLATAWLHHVLGDLDAADACYRTAEETNARLGARSWLAQGRADHAALLDERDRPADRAAAERLRALAGAAAREIGLATVAAGAAQDATRSLAAPAAPVGIFRRVGSTREIAFAGRTVQLPDARGLRDLAELLARPGIAVSVLELDGGAGGGGGGARGAPALDERARREIRARLRELDEEEADAEAGGDGERAALARERRQELAEAVARDFGLGGRSRLVGDPVERARKTVSTRIRRAIAAVGRAHPELGRHLERSVDTGAWCAYRPAEPVDWTT